MSVKVTFTDALNVLKSPFNAVPKYTERYNLRNACRNVNVSNL